MQGHALFVQLGRIPPVVGAFPRRAYGRDNALLATPLAYQYLMALRPDAIAASTDDLLGMRARGWQPSFPVGSDDVDTGLPLVSSAQWPTGGEAYWRRGWIEAAGALTLGGPAAPLVFGVHRGYEWSGRVAVTLPWGGIAGLSGARGRWLDDTLLAEIGGDARGQAAQTLIAMDAEYGRGPWLLRGEWLHTVFAVPLRDAPDVDRLPVASGFLDVQYRITPRWQIAWRLDHLAFGRLPSMSLPSPTWDADVLRIEGVVSYRATRRFEIRAGWLQHWRDGGSVRRRGAPAVQALYWF
jgi:hypothetical protein